MHSPPSHDDVGGFVFDFERISHRCICCTVRQDLVEVLKKLAKRSEKGLKLDAIVFPGIA